MKIKTGVKITPALASEMLIKNTFNRRLRQRTIELYAKQMIEGKWINDTGDPIRISKNNILLDGQHRLNAVIVSGVTIEAIVIYNLDDNIFSVLDTGAKRTPGDVFYIAGVKNSNILPSIIKRYYLFRNNKQRHNQVWLPETNNDLLNEYKKDPDTWDVVARKTNKWYNDFAKILSPAIIGGTFAYFCEFSVNSAVVFFDQLCSGINTSNNVNLLRIKLMQNKASNKKLTDTDVLALIVYTWNLCRSGKTVKVLKYDSERMNFPDAI